MARKKTEDNGPAGAPEWMLTFSDCMTLLLTFFVLLMSFASFDDETIPELGKTFSRVFPGVGIFGSSVERVMKEKNASYQLQIQKKGTETPATSNKTKGSNYMREKTPLDFCNLKVFAIASDVFFYGRGTAISTEGKQTLDALAAFLKHQTGRVVISESGPDGSSELGFNRAMTILRYLAEEKGLGKQRFSLTTQTTMCEKNPNRRIEITLLERNVYE